MTATELADRYIESTFMDFVATSGEAGIAFAPTLDELLAEVGELHVTGRDEWVALWYKYRLIGHVSDIGTLTMLPGLTIADSGGRVDAA